MASRGKREVAMAFFFFFFCAQVDAAALMQSAASVATEAAGAAPAVKFRRFHKHNAAALTLLSWVCKVGDTLIWNKKKILKCTTGPKDSKFSIMLLHIDFDFDLRNDPSLYCLCKVKPKVRLYFIDPSWNPH